MKNVAFPVYYNWYDWLRKNLPPEERCEVTDALRDYYETGASPEEALRFANACGAICTTRIGAGTALKNREQVLQLMNAVKAATGKA